MLEHDLDYVAHVDPLDHALDDALLVWKAWSHRPGDAAPSSYPNRSMGIAWRPCADWQDWESQVDDRIAAAVDAAVDDLPRDERMAVHVHVLRVRWVGAPADYAGTLLRARHRLIAALVRRHVLISG